MALEEDIPKLGALTSELQLIVHTASQNTPDPLVCFDILTKLLVTIENEPKESLLALQRRCEDTLQSLLILGAPPPIRRLSASAMVRFIQLGDMISIYSRVSSLQGQFSEKGLKPPAIIGIAQCLGALSRHHGQKIMSGFSETVNIVGKLIRSSEVGIRLAAMQLLQDAVEGMQGGGSVAAHGEAVKIVMRYGVSDRSPLVRAAGADCLRATAASGGPGLAGGGLEPLASLCVKALDDLTQSVRDSFASALGALIALGLNPQAQIQGRGKGPTVPPKPMEVGLQKYLITPFSKASGPKTRDLRMAIAVAWVAFLQGMRLTYRLTDMELAPYAQQVISMLTPSSKSTLDTHAQLSAPDASPSMLVAALRIVAHLLTTLGEVTPTSCEEMCNVLISNLTHSSAAVRVEAAFVLKALAEVDPSCSNGLMSSGICALRAHRDAAASEKTEKQRADLDGLQGQAALLAALLVAAPRLPLGVPSRLPSAILDLAQQMILHPECKSVAGSSAEGEAGWMLIAAFVSSMPKKELEEHELEFIALWTVPFGGNCLERLKKIEAGNLVSEISGWSAAMEALTAFIKNYMVPSMSVSKEGLLLSPVLNYLNGVLTCLNSPSLQEASPPVQLQAELLVIHTLQAYLALGDPLLYQSDHQALLNICISPFRDGSAYPPSSCLRQLLDPSDAALGPWVPGRDSLEDELRSFRGGSDGLLPRVWDSNVPGFPQRVGLTEFSQGGGGLLSQPISQATSLVDSMLLCFTSIYSVQAEPGKRELLEVVINCLKLGRKQQWRAASAVNVCVALVGSLKNCIAVKEQVQPSAELLKLCQMVIQGILAADPSAPAYKRAAAEALGMLARLGDDLYAARLVRSLLTDAESTTEASQKGAIALALGCVRRRWMGRDSVGGMALSTLVAPSVQVLCRLARDSTEGLHIWALHALWLTADAAGLSYIPHVQATLSLAMDMLLSEEHHTPGLHQSVGRLVNAMVAVLGPELVPGSPVFSRCKSIVSGISSTEEPSAQLECVLYTQQLVLFAPQAVPVHVHVETLRATLSSRQPSLRQAAVSTLRHMSERDPAAMVDEQIEEDLFAMLDSETNSRIVRDVCLTLERLLEAACPHNPSRWLRLCRNVVLAASATKKAGEDREYQAVGGRIGDGGPGEDDEAGMVAHTTRLSGGDRHPGEENNKANASAKDADQLPRFRTRFFAAECLSRLPSATGDDSAHFDLVLAREERQISEENGELVGDWLVLHLSELVALAYQVATGTLETVRPMGVSLLSTVLTKFGYTKDPEYEGHFLLEQYQAQLLSTVRAAFEPTAGPLLVIAGSKLAAQIVTSGVTGGERAILQRIVALISKPLSQWEELEYSSYAEWVGCKVRVELLAAHARVKCFALMPEVHTLGGFPERRWSMDHSSLNLVLQGSSKYLSRHWVGLLRDYAVARSQPGAIQASYKPSLASNSSSTYMAMIQQSLDGVWPVILKAVTIDARPIGEQDSSNVHAMNGNGEVLDSQGGLEERDFIQVWALALLILSDSAESEEEFAASAGSYPWDNLRVEEVGSGRLSPEEEKLVALRAFQSLSTPAFCRPSFLSVELCTELVQVLFAIDVIKHQTLQTAVVDILAQVVEAAPADYYQNSELTLGIAELGLASLHRLLASETGTSGKGHSAENEAALLMVMHALGAFAGHLDRQWEGVLIPQLLCAALKVLRLAPTSGPILITTVGLTTKLVNVGPPGGTAVEDMAWSGQRAAIVTSAIESVGQMADRIITGALRRASQTDASAGPDALPSPRQSPSRQASYANRRTSFDGDSVVSPRFDRQISMGRRRLVQSDSLKSDGPLERSITSPGSRRNSRNEAADADPETSQRLPMLLTLMNVMAAAIPQPRGDALMEHLNEQGGQRCIGCLRTALLSPIPLVQMASLQTMRNLLQSASGKAPMDPLRIWALFCMQQLGEAISGLIYSACQEAAMTAAIANIVMESLKLFLLLHTLVEGEERQKAVLAVLLPTAIYAAAPRDEKETLSTSEAQVHSALISLVVRIVQRFASSSASQLQAVAAALPSKSKIQLQAIIKASTSGQTEEPPPTAASAGNTIPEKQKVLPGTKGIVLPGGLLPPPPVALLAPPQASRSSSLKQEVPPVAVKNQTDDDEEDDDEWDAFQSHRAAGPPSEAVPGPIVSGLVESVASNGSTDGFLTVDEDEWDAFQGNQVRGKGGEPDSGTSVSFQTKNHVESEMVDDDDDWDDFQTSNVESLEAAPLDLRGTVTDGDTDSLEKENVDNELSEVNGENSSPSETIDVGIQVVEEIGVEVVEEIGVEVVEEIGVEVVEAIGATPVVCTRETETEAKTETEVKIETKTDADDVISEPTFDEGEVGRKVMPSLSSEAIVISKVVVDESVEKELAD